MPDLKISRKYIKNIKKYAFMDWSIDQQTEKGLLLFTSKKCKIFGVMLSRVLKEVDFTVSCNPAAAQGASGAS